MNRTITIGIMALSLFASAAAAQTAAEQTRILRDFERRVDDYARHAHLTTFPGTITPSVPVPTIFTPPAAMVFRQLIARAIAVPRGGQAIGSGVRVTVNHPTVLQPFPGSELSDFPKVLSDALPALPTALEYRLINNDLVIRDANGDVVIAVLRDALGTATAR